MRIKFWYSIGVSLLIATQCPASFPLLAASLPVYKADNSRSQADMLLNEGLKLFYQRKFNEAISKLESALTIYRATGSRLQEASCLFHIGFAKQGLRDFAGAIKSLQPTLLFWQETRNFTLKEMTLTLIGFAYEGQGNLEEAVTVYKQAVDVNEKIVGGIKVEEYQLSFAMMQGLLSERLSILLSLAGRYEESFNYVERAKARAFLDQYVRGSIDFRKNGDAELLAKGDGLEQEIATVRNRLIKAQNNSEIDNTRETLEKLDSLEKQYEDWYLELKNRSPETASLKRVEVASLGEIQKAIAQIDSDTTLVEYFVTDGGTLVFIITTNSLKMLRLPASRKDLRAAIDRWSQGDSTNRDNNHHPASLQELYTQLIAPVKSYITTSTIGIIPHDLLNSVPFPGLTDGKRNLIDDYAMFVLPNASILPFLPGKRKPSTGTILALAMGNPQLSTPPDDPPLSLLKGVGEEVREIKEIYPKTQVLEEQAATETAVVSQAGKYEILHIAAHAVYKQKTPLSSTIYVAKDNRNDGNLQVRDLYGLNLTAATNLVVLTGCEAQRGDVNYGDEITSLSRGFMYAGTPSIIANLWLTSDDESTKILMQRFYSYLPKMGKAKALRQAQIDVRNHNSKYSHPFYWGGFMLTGDWGKL
ncbi:CHAT domain-containing protein [Microcoleus sp. OTE_8_concoct_300]|uniref:CHAT domain-containing protein n=1 Tax=Microcoleus sp. OTE_8_concoct_300 TaxID=2964710 RepID=UPI00403F00E3